MNVRPPSDATCWPSINSSACAMHVFHNLLKECAKAENLLVVGHNPNLTTFLGSLLVPNGNSAASVRLRKGSLARLNLTRGPATLQGLLDPRTVRALYATSTKSSRRKTSRK